MPVDLMVGPTPDVRTWSENKSFPIRAVLAGVHGRRMFTCHELGGAGEKQERNYTIRGDSCYRPGDFVWYHYKPAANSFA